MGCCGGEEATEPSRFLPASGPLPCESGDQPLIQGYVPRWNICNCFAVETHFTLAFLFVGERGRREGEREEGEGEWRGRETREEPDE